MFIIYIVYLYLYVMDDVILLNVDLFDVINVTLIIVQNVIDDVIIYIFVVIKEKKMMIGIEIVKI